MGGVCLLYLGDLGGDGEVFGAVLVNFEVFDAELFEFVAPEGGGGAGGVGVCLEVQVGDASV